MDDWVLENLCYHDINHPRWEDLHGFDEPDEILEPRKDCYCDNCFYGRDKLALEILKLRDRSNGNRNLVSNRVCGCRVHPCFVGGVKEMKYIRFDDAQDTIVVFPNHINHRVMARSMGNVPLLSAGFVQINNESVECYGESVGLELSSLDDDSRILHKQIFAWTP